MRSVGTEYILGAVPVHWRSFMDTSDEAVISGTLPRSRSAPPGRLNGIMKGWSQVSPTTHSGFIECGQNIYIAVSDNFRLAVDVPLVVDGSRVEFLPADTQTGQSPSGPYQFGGARDIVLLP